MVPCQDSHQDIAPSPPVPSLPFQMDPVQKAVISHTFGVPAPLKKKQFISCNICHLRFNSAVSGGSDGAGSEQGPLSGPSPAMDQSHPPELPVVTVGSMGAVATGAALASLGCLQRSHPSLAMLDLQCLGLILLCQQNSQVLGFMVLVHSQAAQKKLCCPVSGCFLARGAVPGESVPLCAPSAPVSTPCPCSYSARVPPGPPGWPRLSQTVGVPAWSL